MTFGQNGMVKVRVFPEHNYLAVWKDGKTVRFQIEDDKPITELLYPEFYDVKITGRCSGKCPWCYMDSSENESDYDNILEKTENLFRPMNQNQRPFQVALGGGNPNEHPDFISLLLLYNSLGITPNYTTNGMGVDNSIAMSTKTLSGGVAVSMHPHLEKYWTDAIDLFNMYNVDVVNAHIIISDRDSIDYLKDMYQKFFDKITYFVLLPYEIQGRAEPKQIDYEYLTSILLKINNMSNIAFGAGFYEYLKTSTFKMSLYEPEIMSKYLDMKDMKFYYSSFDLREWNEGTFCNRHYN